MGGEKPKTALGLEPNIEAAACYALWFITGIVILVLEKKELKSIRFHAWQSVAVFAPLFVISMVIGALPIIGPMISMLITLAGACLWLILMLKAFQGEMFKLPIAGNFAEQQVAKESGGQVQQPQHFSSPQQSGSEAAKASFCPNCGKPAKPGSAFCEQCGRKIA